MSVIIMLAVKRALALGAVAGDAVRG